MKTHHLLNRRILYIDNKSALSYFKGYIYYDEVGRDAQKQSIGNFINRSGLLERLTRKEPRCAAKVDDNHILFSFHGNILNYCIQDNSMAVEHQFSKGMNNPLEFLSIDDPTAREKTILYGEYIWNEDKGPVDIYRRKNGVWKCVFSFPEKTITHIHNIVFDKYREGFFVLTGDDDSEAGIWFADMDFKTVKPVLLGKQQYRACVAFPDKKGIYFATDTPLEDNYIYYLELNQDLSVGELFRKFKMPGPCIYGCNHGQFMYFSTSVEPDSTLPKWKYRLTYRLGTGVKDRYTHIIRGSYDGVFQDIYNFKKDVLPIWLFQFGNVIFPANEADEMYVVLQSTIQGHGVTKRLP